MVASLLRCAFRGSGLYLADSRTEKVGSDLRGYSSFHRIGIQRGRRRYLRDRQYIVDRIFWMRTYFCGYNRFADRDKKEKQGYLARVAYNSHTHAQIIFAEVFNNEEKGIRGGFFYLSCDIRRCGGGITCHFYDLTELGSNET